MWSNQASFGFAGSVLFSPYALVKSISVLLVTSTGPWITLNFLALRLSRYWSISSRVSLYKRQLVSPIQKNGAPFCCTSIRSLPLTRSGWTACAADDSSVASATTSRACNDRNRVRIAVLLDGEVVRTLT